MFVTTRFLETLESLKENVGGAILYIVAMMHTITFYILNLHIKLMA